MTTADQSPCSTSQVSVWVPEPCAEAAQKRAAPGAPGLAEPPISRYCAWKGS